MHKGDGLSGSREKEGRMVDPEGTRDTSQGNPGGNFEGNPRRYVRVRRTQSRDRGGGSGVR